MMLEIPVFKGGSARAQIPAPLLAELADPKSRDPRGFGCLRVLTEKDGDKLYTWDRHDYAQIREAKSFFDRCVAEGLVPHRVGVGGRRSAEIMVEFDPAAEEIIFLPVQLVTGG